MGISPAEFQGLLANRGRGAALPPPVIQHAPAARKGSAKAFAVGGKASGPSGAMNRLEAAYAAHLEGLRLAGEVVAWRFGALSLVVVDNRAAGAARAIRYRPDFLVILPPSNRVRIVETKGFLREDAALRFEMAASAYPWWEFIMVRRAKGGGAWETMRHLNAPRDGGD